MGFSDDTRYRATLPSEIVSCYDFQKRFGFIANQTPTHLTTRLMADRVGMILEETAELAEAAEAQDMEKILDALIDLVYFIKGTAVQLGLGEVWHHAFHEVHRANMAKVIGTGHRGVAHDVIKPPGWIPPRLGTILEGYGYNRAAFLDPITGQVDEKLCDDVDRPIRRTSP
jgi:predicted HAD superfamily Cof-like phosphohydrolase